MSTIVFFFRKVSAGGKIRKVFSYNQAQTVKAITMHSIQETGCFDTEE